MGGSYGVGLPLHEGWNGVGQCRGGVSHAGVGWVMWGGWVMQGWGVSCRGGVGWVM